MRRPTRQVLGRLALLLASAWIANGAAESALQSHSITDRLRGGSDGWRAVWIARHGEDSPSAALAYDAFDAELGWTLAPGLRDVPLAGAGKVGSTSRGARGTREHAIPKPPGARRVVAIGDSFTFGDEVDDAETFPAQLERALPGVEVVNLAVHGYGHDQMLLRLRRDGLAYAPDVVLLGWVEMDADRDLLAFRDYAKPRFDLRDGRLVLATSRLPSPAELVASARWTPSLVALGEAVWERLTWRDDPERRGTIARALLAEIVREARAAHAVPLFVELPDTPRGAGDRPRQLLAFCEQEKIDCVFPGDDLATASAAGTPLLRLSHYTPEANGVVAASIGRYVASHGVLPSTPVADARER